MTPKEYLEQLPDIKVRINAINRKIAECKERANDISVKQTNNTQHNTTTSKIEINVGDKVDLEKELEALKSEFEMFEIRAIMEINKIPDSLCSGLLIEKYVNGLSWEKVSEVIGKGVEYTRKELHNKALSEFDFYNPESTRKSPCIPPKNNL